MKIFIIIILICSLFFGGCIYDKAKEYSCLQYTQDDKISYTNNVLNNITDNCIGNLIECRK